MKEKQKVSACGQVNAHYSYSSHKNHSYMYTVDKEKMQDKAQSYIKLSLSMKVYLL